MPIDHLHFDRESEKCEEMETAMREASFIDSHASNAEIDSQPHAALIQLIVFQTCYKVIVGNRILLYLQSAHVLNMPTSISSRQEQSIRAESGLSEP